MKKVFKRILIIATIAVCFISSMFFPMPIHAENDELLNQVIGLDYSVKYPLVAYFEGVEEGVLIQDNAFIVPDGFVSGDVVIKAKTCVSEIGIVPNDGETECNDESEITLKIEGIANSEQINNTVKTFSGKISILQGFSDYGKALIHVVNGLDTPIQINEIINIVTKDLISIRASSSLPMSYSFGTEYKGQAMLTNSDRGDISIFFGNNETTLIASGPSVDKITNVVGGEDVSLNNDGSASIKLPKLFEETTTTVVVTIKMKDGSFVEKQININRTAILLQYNNGAGDNSVYGGYVFNKAYLYNNQNHSDDMFDAYYQITLYKDDVVVGFKQVKIDDESLVNSLDSDESGSIELYSDSQIPLYGKITDDLIEGVNKISVFLTNGPIEFDKELPSVEFGIGAGVTLEWEEN